ncbi:hypothetical protein V1525DRAFT_79949 [Lipomyces kononenkoae]|uniref:Uncharacterized protein n=1 Tax=Lipomyces kononenkoae TaxID=34357 RepID=A0ACC3T584_LIPKO
MTVEQGDLEANIENIVDNSGTLLREKKSFESPSQGSTDNIVEDEHIEVKWDEPNDPDNPQSRSKFRRWLAICIVSTGTFCV